MNYWVKIGLVLCAIWAIAAGVIFWARSSKPTTQSVAAYVKAHPLDSLSGAERQKVISRMENMLNLLSMDERQELQREKVTRGFYDSLTKDEQGAFLDATLPTGFRQMMDAFNKMDHAKREEIVQRISTEMQNHPGEHPPNLDDKEMQKIVDQGLRAFYSEASADTKLDLAPLVEQMQKNLQYSR